MIKNIVRVGLGILLTLNVYAASAQSNAANSCNLSSRVKRLFEVSCNVGKLASDLQVERQRKENRL